MKTYHIALIPGDTVGPELIRQAQKVLHLLSASGDAAFNLLTLTVGGPALAIYGHPLPELERKKAASCQAILLGNIGSSRYQHLPLSMRPENALLELRKWLSVCTNLRPVRIRSGMNALSPLKPEFLTEGFDILVVRDIQGGMFAGKGRKGFGSNGKTASDLELYDEAIIEATARRAFETAALRRQKVTSLDKANVLTSSSLWRKTVTKLSAAYPDIQLTHQYIDTAAMNVIKGPGHFDVILTNNVFGDIISDELTQLTGTPSLFGSAELAADSRGIYTPNQLHHPDESLTSQNTVSPVGMLDAVAMMLSYSCGEEMLAMQLNRAIDIVLEQQLTTPELPIPGFTPVSTDELGDEIVKALKHLRE